ncbi:hypothetical protein P4H94_16610 [Paenibacillus macerans]|uniref:Uncharacterized protein n=1 Tax=Paenibacillus macerans TaxID=44252 RepID=A0A090ZU37_PAEMA|nr:hypothetical protein [Paenibacillus macerans]KFN07636.1 hypothetical protein DJ90_6101 [Paenibacillus macerans]MBS5914703.1 hypothetical protein [Paenibacillus macerans]MCY7559603.1 hypothetical protein [Paenibacillus macerans]MDU5949640.1 hypothetical protein [Paenibacillus macerans]MEC0138480.1 hypothetical protein [Paenibacillus macerans]
MLKEIHDRKRPPQGQITICLGGFFGCYFGSTMKYGLCIPVLQPFANGCNHAYLAEKTGIQFLTVAGALIGVKKARIHRNKAK